MHFFAPDIGIDLGSSNTLVYVKKRGIVISEPTLVVVSGTNKKQVQSVGDEARRVLGRLNDSKTIIRPIRNGAIADFDMTALLLKYFLRKAIGVSNVVKPKVVISVPAGLDDVNRKAITEAVRLAGAKKVYLVDKFENLTVDLSAQDYGFTAAEGKQEGRFMLMIESDEATGIESVGEQEAVTGNDVLYNVSGQRVGSDYKGIVIKNGKKVLVK